MIDSASKTDQPAREPPQSLGIVPTGWTQQMDLRFISIAEGEVVAELSVSEKHYQPMGIVHGGVYCRMVETVCSVGAHVHAGKRGLMVVGVDNQTSFLKATRTGVLRASARPLSVGRRTQLWEANVHDERSTLVATGRVRLVCLEPDSNLAGQAASTLVQGNSR
jgi:1,4-dihydroxy-2-naphthoyl-CoA hydrolase